MKSANLDFLRACAVLFVLIGHLLQTWRVESLGVVTIYDLGQTGVLIFFVHTSLVLMLALERQARDGSGGLFGRFYVRRIFRIYPLAMVTVLAMVWLRLPAFPTLAYQAPGVKTVLANLGLVQNLTNSPSVYAPLWSLPYEVQMYVVLPVLFVVLRRRAWAAPVLWAAAAVGVAVCTEARVKGWALLLYVPCFLAGVVAYGQWTRCPRRWPAWVWPAAIAACVLARSAAGAFVGASGVTRAGWVACLLLGWAAPRIRELPDGWVQRASAVVAKYSYGIYLSHGVVLWAAFVALKDAPLAVRIAVWAIGTAGLPVVCFHAIENPMVELGVRITKRRRANARVVAIDNGARSYARQVR